jgi:hypothetical protein
MRTGVYGSKRGDVCDLEHHGLCVQYRHRASIIPRGSSRTSIIGRDIRALDLASLELFEIELTGCRALVWRSVESFLNGMADACPDAADSGECDVQQLALFMALVRGRTPHLTKNADRCDVVRRGCVTTRHFEARQTFDLEPLAELSVVATIFFETNDPRPGSLR